MNHSAVRTPPLPHSRCTRAPARAAIRRELMNLRKNRRFAARAAGIALPALFAAGFAQAQSLPSFSIGSGTLTLPVDADTYYCATPTGCTASGTRQLWTTNYPVEITALAKALHNNVDTIYQY